MKKHRPTTFARLFFFLVFFIPVAYGIIMFSQGKNPLQEIKKLIGIKGGEVIAETKSSEDLTIELLRSEVETLQDQLKACQDAHK